MVGLVLVVVGVLVVGVMVVVVLGISLRSFYFNNKENATNVEIVNKSTVRTIY